MAPLITHGAIMASWVKPAMNVCVPQLPNGAEAVSRVPRRLRPRNRTRLVFTGVSSTGWQGIAQQCPEKQYRQHVLA
jgi:hypothetical protein